MQFSIALLHLLELLLHKFTLSDYIFTKLRSIGSASTATSLLAYL
jgi:hypothetical protein